MKRKLKELLGKNPCKIEIRTNYSGVGAKELLYGFCEWNGKELIPCDNKEYSLDMDVLNYHWWMNELTDTEHYVIWIHTDWRDINNEEK